MHLTLELSSAHVRFDVWTGPKLFLDQVFIIVIVIIIIIINIFIIILIQTNLGPVHCNSFSFENAYKTLLKVDQNENVYISY